MSDMGMLRTSVRIAPLTDESAARRLDDVLVDTGSEYNWFPRQALVDAGVTIRGQERFQTADGRLIVRDIGWALLSAAGRTAPVVVVFAEPNDQTLLGAVGLESLNLRVDLARRELVHAGPVIVAVAA